MSTKTTFKRIALVAVAALGTSLVSVAPASADAISNTELGTVTISAPGAGRVGSAFMSKVNLAAASGQTIANDDTMVLRAILVSKPAGSTAALSFTATGTSSSYDGHTSIVGAGASGNELLAAKMTVVANSPNAQDVLAAGSIGFIPDVLGNYVIRVWADSNSDGVEDAAEKKSANTTFAVGAAPSTITVSAINATAVAGAGTGHGSLVKVVLKDASGNPAGLASGEAIRVVPGTTADIFKINNVDPTYTPAALTSTAGFKDLVASDFKAGVAWLNIRDAAGTTTVTYTGVGTDVATLSASQSLTFKTVNNSGLTGSTVILKSGTTGVTYGTDGVAGTNATTVTIPIATKTITYLSTYTAGGTAAEYYEATITDSDGYITGSTVTGMQYSIAYLAAADATTATTMRASFSVKLTDPDAAGLGFNATTGGGTALVSGVTTAAAALTNGTVTVSPSATLAAKYLSSVTYAVTVKDQFGNVYPNATVGMVITGRNATVTQVNKTTDASGVATFTVTDAALSTSTTYSDSITFKAIAPDASATTKTSSAVTINWSATGPAVGKVTILGGDNGTTTGVASASPNVKDISAGDGAEAGAQPFTATVTDAAGNILVGVPVTFTVSGTTAAVTSTTQTVYTGAAGTAAANVYAWVEGTYTVTATAGGIAGTAGFTVAQQTNTEARAISATVSGTIVTAKVVDRFGNNVPGVTVYATKTGPGFFGSGVTSTKADTNAAGIAEFVIAGGSAEVTVSTLDPNAAAGTKAFGQTCAAANFVGCLTTSTALTAATVGTATKAEVGIGASLSAAGVSSAKVSVTADTSTTDAATAAADAAAEATDAANAATDAANAAAEAADAATAAAQDAADAVAALATSVSEMVDALKKQITSLTNLVIKIQKKVRA